ncbi:MAG: hypothetical protein HQL56_18550 [Magnetococcales bacterium]|nr:hypothetical protein [Magnetococcales bacterium]
MMIADKTVNVEVLHIASEAINHNPDKENCEFIIPTNWQKEIEDNIDTLYGVMLDDTDVSSGGDICEKQLRKHIGDLGLYPCTFIKETQLAPLVAAIFQLLPRDRIAERMGRIYLHNSGKPPKHCREVLLLRLENGESYGNLHSTEALQISSSSIHLRYRPSCQFYVTAWYIFRLLTPKKKWIELANTYDDLTKEDFIKKMASDILINRIGKPTPIITFLHEHFTVTENIARYLGSQLTQKTISGMFNSNILIRNKYFNNKGDIIY